MESPGLSKDAFRLVYLGLLTSTCLSALESTIVAVALQTISEDLGNAELSSWVGAAYMLTAACLVPIWGKSADVFGRKATMLTCQGLFALGSLGCGTAQSMQQLIAWRALQGAGAGGVSSLSRVIIADGSTLQDRGKYLGMVSAVWGISNSIGGFTGGLLLSITPWRTLFLINIPFVATAALLHFRHLNIPLIHRGKTMGDHLREFDTFGLVTIVGGSACLMFGLSKASSGASQLPFVLYSTLGMVALLLGAKNEITTSKSPLIPPSIFQSRVSAAVLVINALHGIAFMAASYYLPVYFQVLGNTPLQAGLRTLPFAIGTCITSPTTGFALAKYPFYRTFMLGSLSVMMAGYVALCLLGSRTGWAAQELLIFLPALGIGPGWSLTTLCFQASLPSDLVATAMSGFSLIRSIAGAAGVTIASSVYSITLRRQLSSASFDGRSLAPYIRTPISQLRNLEPVELRDQVIRMHTDSMRSIWLTMSVLVAVALCCVTLVPGAMGQYTVAGRAPAKNDGVPAAEELRVSAFASEEDGELGPEVPGQAGH